MTKPATSLRALTDARLAGIKKNDSFRIDPNLIHFEEGFNLRQPGKEMDDHIERLYQAMKAGAQVPPIDVAVVDGKVIARDGHCRTVAAKRWRKEMPEYTVECRQLRGNDTDAILHMLGTGTGGKPLSPLEAGLGFLRLVKMGLSNKEIAEKLGVSRVTVDNGITLAEAPRDVQKLIMNGEVSATTVRGALKNGKEGIEDLKKAAKENAIAPTTTKSGKKKKVTAKKLKGTKAEKKTKKRKAKSAPPDTLPPVDPDAITITIPRDVATESAARIKSAATCPELKQLGAIIETALL